MQVLLIFFLLALPCTAIANDAEYGNYAGTPGPVKNDAISMVSEDILIQERTQGGWQVSSTYVFQNTTDKPVKLSMGFPEMSGDDPTEFLEFKTTVKGEVVKVKTAKSAPFLKLGSAPLGRVHLFDVDFLPGETVTVAHDYKMEGGGSVAIAIEKTVQYVTRTGALWKGPIGRAQFTIRTHDVYELLAWSPEFKFKSLRHFVIQKGVSTGMELVLENKDWTPKGDLVLDLMTDDGGLQRKATGGECPELEKTDYRAFRDAPLAQKPDFLRVSDLAPYDAARLRLCRNWRYARYGYVFKDPKLNARFYGKVHVGKYPPGMEHIEDFEASDRMLAPLMRDPDFSPAMLDAEDIFYLKALRTEEQRRRQPVK